MSELEYDARDLARAFSDFLSSYRYLENEVKELEATLKERDNCISDLEAKLKSMEDKLGENEDLVTQLETLRKENEAYSQKIESLEKKINEYETTIRDLLSEKQEKERLEAKLDELSSSYKVLENEYEATKEKMEELEKKLYEAEEKLSKFEISDKKAEQIIDKYVQKGIPEGDIRSAIKAFRTGNLEEILFAIASGIETILYRQEALGLSKEELLEEVRGIYQDVVRGEEDGEVLYVNGVEIGPINKDSFTTLVNVLSGEGIKTEVRTFKLKDGRIRYELMSLDYAVEHYKRQVRKLKSSIKSLTDTLK